MRPGRRRAAIRPNIVRRNGCGNPQSGLVALRDPLIHRPNAHAAGARSRTPGGSVPASQSRAQARDHREVRPGGVEINMRGEAVADGSLARQDLLRADMNRKDVAAAAPLRTSRATGSVRASGSLRVSAQASRDERNATCGRRRCSRWGRRSRSGGRQWSRGLMRSASGCRAVGATGRSTS
jgi:hypothetical protein